MDFDQLDKANIIYFPCKGKLPSIKQWQTLSNSKKIKEKSNYGILCGKNSNITVIDIDNCDPTTKLFITFLLAQPNTHYITNDELTPYGLISKNRIWNLDAVVAAFTGEEEDDEEDDDDESERQ